MDQQFARTFEDTLRKLARNHPLLTSMDDNSFGDAIGRLPMPNAQTATAWMASLTKYQRGLMQLWVDSLPGNAGSDDRKDHDRRFSDAAWNQGIFSVWRDAYKLTADAMAEMADATGLPPHEQRKFSFYARLMADALAPSNFAATNPEVLNRIRETNGQNLLDGFKNLMADLERGYISTTDEDAFHVGQNLATTPGSVVFRNELVELIQYHPMTKRVQARPVLIVPPCVNKFYIFDLNDRKSMIRHMLEQGLSVYAISWRNPSATQPDRGWDEYVSEGIFAALNACQQVSQAGKVDLLSWCNGGTMLMVALAVMDRKLKDRVGTATFMSSLIDFRDPGELEVFIDGPQIEAYKQRQRAAKVAPGRDIAQAMAMLHVNESVWGFVINNYLMGKSPAPFDVLYWNADTSNLPSKWFSYYVEKMYHQNLLKEAGGLEILGKAVDTAAIDVPCYFVGAIGDHIVPWRTSFDATHLVGGDAEFVLTDGGHVSGTVINHPVKSRRSYFHGGDRSLPADGWKESATPVQGSWWPHWIDWLDRNGNEDARAAPAAAGSKDHPVLGPAPGTYVIETVSQSG